MVRAKYRAFYASRMYEVAKLDFWGYKDLETCDLAGVGSSGDPEELFEIPLTEITLMQYTGFVDKHGKEIYEGDILSNSLQGKRFVYYPFNDRVASYGLHNASNGMCSTLQDSHRVYEVIGNIYENPEMVGKGV